MHGPPAPDDTVATDSKSPPPPPPQRMSPPIPPPTTTPPPPPPSHLSNFSQVSQSDNIPYPQDETEKESTQGEIVKPEYTTPSVSQSSILVNITCTFISLFHHSL